MTKRYTIYSITTNMLLHSVSETDKNDLPCFNLNIKDLGDIIAVEKNKVRSGVSVREQKQIDDNDFITVKSNDNIAFNQIYEYYKLKEIERIERNNDDNETFDNETFDYTFANEIIAKNIIFVKFSEYKFYDNLENKVIPRALKKYDKNQENAHRFQSIEYIKHNNLSVGHYIFDNSFKVTFGDGETVEFVRFEKSQSMARNCIIAFIKKEIKDKIEKRITLGLDGKIEEANISKWHAYKGLSFTNASKVHLDLDQNKVIVVAEGKISETANNVPRMKVITAMLTGETAGKMQYELTEAKEEAIEIKQYDGAGLISFDYAEKIENQIKKHDHEKMTSFQFRMPFCKGMLHKVDFKRFFKEELNLTTINDIWGNEHNVDDVEIILTEGQYKGKKWFEDIYGKDNKPKSWDKYWEKFKQYNHKLYISQYNKTNKQQGESEKLNYQVLHTLDIDNENFGILLESSIEEYRKIKSEHEAQIIHFLDNLITEDEQWPNEELMGDEHTASKPNDAYMLYRNTILRNPRFIRESKIKSTINNIALALKDDFRVGHFIVKGKNRFLCPDLLKLLFHIAIKDHKDLRDNNPVINPKNCIKNGCFYAPGFDESSECDSDKKYSIIRNPHISRNEHVVAKLESPSSLLKEYFGHLEGVCMINPVDCFAERLSGADYDGDMVKIIDNEIFVAAANHDLPLIKIPGPPDPNHKDVISQRLEWKTIGNTFNNSVGLYSNYAFSIALRAYEVNSASR